MLSGGNGSVWMEDKDENEESASWARANNKDNGGNREEMNSLANFKSMLEVEDEWYLPFSPNLGDPENLLLQAVDSSSSCSPSSSVFNNLADPSSQGQFIMAPKPTISSLLAVVSNNPLDPSFDLSELGFLGSQNLATGASQNLENRVLGNFGDLGSNNLGLTSFRSASQFPGSRMIQFPESGSGFSGFRGFDENGGDALFMNRSKLLRPLETFPSVGAQPTLFQKRAAALRKNLAETGGSSATLGVSVGSVERDKGKKKMGKEMEKKRKISNIDDLDEFSCGDASALNYDSDEIMENINRVKEIGKNGGNNSNGNSTVTGEGDHKGKKKGLPAKNLMAERRRRKKLNDRLYMLRSVVPKISKMDRASILGDAIEYLKELLKKINDLHNELETSTPSSLTTSFHPLTPTPATLPTHVKDEIGPRPLPPLTATNNANPHPARVEVRAREGRGVNIHMYWGRRPGLLLSTMRALDNLGLDIQQAVISCFNGFSMDIFRAEQCKEEDVHPDQIKAVLLDSAGFHGVL
ncbi:PREDICTED: transcription factor ICE1-like [Tarenaya hassleriana]|uniref:transcription factor ICE1-like n=1 Tax=Tarenaya hassleriana TaxID=28532 RepID=UPI00053C27B1|nr:PREDICTED: transcription factor ICE1-like [Tarenaya hassleriana]